DLDSALSQFYEDESLTDALTDQPANTLLKWGEAQVQLLAQQAKDADEFDSQFTALRKLIRNLSRYVAEHQNMAPDEQQESLGKISGFAQSIGLSINKAVDGIIEEQKSLADSDSVSHFLAQFAQTVNQIGANNPSPTPEPSTDSAMDDITEILPKGAWMDFVNKITGAVADAKDQIEQQASSDDDTTTPDDNDTF
ncbi:MAG: hypothetical protein KJ043_16995, partial [Anaerolineae bacterium]|nr:hypothetical protein [Anaerolineae bacterium]